MTSIVHENISLKPYNTFRIDISARYFTTINTVFALQAILRDTKWAKTQKLILGSGSNILFTKDFNGLIIHNHILGIKKMSEDDDHIYLKIGAGENWHKLVLYCVENNYAGIENLSLIPGTVGAAPVQNIGAYGMELKEVLQEVHTIDIKKNVARIFSCQECEFDYRDSIFKHVLKNKNVITHVILRLNKKPIFHLEYDAIKEKLAGSELSIRTISNAVIKIRQEKLPDPKIIPNAGSFFKNPIISKKIFLSLQKKYPKIPYFMEENYFKIPAAWLIEQCGLKGKHFGNVGVHEHQALVLINDGNGTGTEIKKLSEDIQKSVLEKYGIRLVTEVNII